MTTAFPSRLFVPPLSRAELIALLDVSEGRMIGARGFVFYDLPDFDPTTPMGQMVLTMMAIADALAGAGKLCSTDVLRKEGGGG